MLLGISFDVEHTLLVYCSANRDHTNYINALTIFNREQQQQQQRREGDAEDCDEKLLQLAMPQWESDEQCRQQFKRAWMHATQLAVQQVEGSLTESEKKDWAAGLRAPWHKTDKAAVRRFYGSVLEHFFGWNNHPSRDAAAMRETVAKFTTFLVDHFYVSRSVYTLPESIPALAEIRRAFPALPLTVVSNTDSRARDALLLFDEYRRDGCSDGGGVGGCGVFTAILTATEVELLKPAPSGIQAAMRAASVDPTDPEQCRRWLHVGDEEGADGGAARAAGCRFLLCDPATGVDFAKLLELIIVASKGDTKASQ